MRLSNKFLAAGVAVLLTLVSVLAGTAANSAELNGPNVIGAGETNTCAVNHYEEMVCWGGGWESPIPKSIGKVRQVSSRCAIKTDTTVTCWGDITVPENLKLRTKATHLSGSCVAFEKRYVYCLGEPYYFDADSGPADITQLTSECVLDGNGVVRCHLDNSSSWETVFTEDYEIKQIASGDSVVCALSSAGEVHCKYGNKQWIAAENVSSIYASIYGRFCAVAGGTISGCWDWTGWWSDFDPGTPLKGLENISLVSLAGFDNYDCAIVSDELVCPSEGNEPYLGEVVAPATPHSLSVSVGGVDVYLTFSSDNSAKKFGEVKWLVQNGTEILCEFAEGQIFPPSCLVPGRELKSGTTYNLSLVGLNRSGETRTSFPKFVYCAPNPDLVVTTAKTIVWTGSKVAIKGSLSNLCSSPKTFKTRTREAGKPWGKWVSRALPKNLKFSVTQLVSVNTEVQVEVVDRQKTLTSKPLKISAAIKEAFTAQKISFSQTKTSQGFTQGGTIRVVFNGPKSYSASCWLGASTDFAFNFAGTFMGEEAKISRFQVKNGKGTASIKMRWNGKFQVASSCSNKVYADVIGSKVLILRTNY